MEIKVYRSSNGLLWLNHRNDEFFAPFPCGGSQDLPRAVMYYVEFVGAGMNRCTMVNSAKLILTIKLKGDKK